MADPDHPTLLNKAAFALWLLIALALAAPRLALWALRGADALLCLLQRGVFSLSGPVGEQAVRRFVEWSDPFFRWRE